MQLLMLGVVSMFLISLESNEVSINRLANEIAFDEGFSETPYQDTVGVWTVGYGWNLEARPISKAMARQHMLEIIKEGMEYLERFPFWDKANGARKHAFVNMYYNLGRGGFNSFKKMIAAANDGDWNKAAKEAVDSKWYVQVRNRGPRVTEAIRTGIHREIL